jgi:hypothetical protein
MGLLVDQTLFRSVKEINMRQKIQVGVVLAVMIGVSLIWLTAPQRLFAGTEAGEAVPALVSFQGFLAGSNGDPLADGSYPMTFAIYDAATGGALIWAETHTGVAVSNGYFSVMLGSGNCTNGCPFGADGFSNGAARYLQTSVDTGGGFVDFPRQRLASVPYAFRSERAEHASTADTAVSANTAITATSANTADTAISANTAISATSASTANTAGSAPWSGLTGVPSGFADNVDNDTLGDLGCSVNQIAKWNGSAWVCAPDETGGSYENVITVATSGGDFTSVAAALASISDSSSSNRYLVRVMPGVYTETDLVVVKNYVHVQGSGPNATVVTSSRSSGSPGNASATVDLLDHGRISNLTVRNTGTGTYSIALYSAETSRATVVDNVVAEAIGAGGTGHYAAYWNDAEAIIRNSTLLAGGATGFGTAVNAAFGSVNIAGGFPQALIENSRLIGGSNNNREDCVDNTGTGFGMQLSNSSPMVRDSYICGGHRGVGVYTNGNAQIQNSSVKASSTGSAFLFEISASGSISVANSGVAYFGNRFTGAGTGLRCVHAYDLGTYQPKTNGTTSATACL